MKKRVLVIDDDPGIQYLLQAVFTGDDQYELDFADNGTCALEKVRRVVPDLILLDLMMPVMDGRTFLERVRALDLCSQVPVILLTANVQAQQNVQDLHVSDCIIKPFHVRDLLRKVTLALQ